MKKYLFVGGTEGNTGPDNVNKGIVANLNDNFCFIKSRNKVKKYLDMIYNVICCKVIVVSGLSKIGMYAIKLSKILKKKTIYIMHGCSEIEFVLNEMPSNEKSLEIEKYILHNTDLILAVSKKFSDLIQEKYPACKGRIGYLHNGVEKNSNSVIKNNIIRQKGSIIAVGGDRKLKNNIIVAKAMKKLDEKKILKVYGHIYDEDNLLQGDNIEFKGLVPQTELYTEMMKSELYVLNSIYEPFALSVFDALLCGCSILISNIAGALEVLDVTENDIIKDPMDEEEIANKIEYLLQNPNNERIIKKLDFDKISYKAEVEKLDKICNKLYTEN